MYPTIYSTRMGNILPTLFNEFFNDSFLASDKYASANMPATNILEDDKAFNVELATPGMTKDDVKINIDNDNLVITMEKKVAADNADSKADKKYLRKEFSYSKFQKTMSLPENVQKEAISATMADGILKINIPKITAEDKEKAIKYIEIN